MVAQIKRAKMTDVNITFVVSYSVSNTINWIKTSAIKTVWHAKVKIQSIVAFSLLMRRV